MIDKLAFRLLGRFEVTVDGRPVPLGGPRQQSVLALLLLARGKAVPSGRLLHLVWDGDPPASGLSTLHAYIARLRKTLGPAGDCLTSTPLGYAIKVPADDVDAWTVEMTVEKCSAMDVTRDPAAIVTLLRPALQSWRGSLLAGELGEQPWALPHVARLDERRQRMIEMFAEAQLAMGRHREVIDLLDEAVGTYPHRERLVVLQMLALYRSARQADSLAAYSACRRRLVEDLGIEPSFELNDLHLAVLEHRPDIAGHVDSTPVERILPVRDWRFLGREPLLADVGAALAANPVVVCTGLSGSGKSSLALELAYRHRGFTCWLRAGNDGTISASVTTLARILGHPDVADLSECLRRLWNDIGDRVDPLVVFDSAVDPEMLRPYLPPPDRVRTLVTSVNAAWRALGVSVPVGPMSVDESYTMLRARTGSQDAAAIAELAEDLGHLPLALAQAAAFIDASGMDVRDYLGLLDHHRDDMLLREGAVDGHDTLGTVWELSLATLDAESPEAVALLETLAYLAPDSVPMQLLRSGHDQADGGDLEISEAVARLRRFSLVERSGPMFRVHRLVQAAARRRLTPQRRVERLARAAGLLIAAEPGDWTAPAARRRSAGLVPHLVAVLWGAESLGFRSPELLGVARRCVAFLRHSASYRAARTIMTALLRWTVDWPSSAAVRGELHSEYGDLLDAAGEATLAGEQHGLALDLLRREFGPAHIRVARATTRLAHLRNCLGEPLVAIEMHEGALPLLRAHGDQCDVARALVDLGYASWSCGRLPAAADAFTEAIELLAGGPRPDAGLRADAAGGMGMVRQDQGDIAAAIELHREALAILREVHGDGDHPAPAQAMDKLGFALRLFGDLDGALKAHDAAVRMLTGTLGADDPRVGMALTNEGLALLDAGDARAAAADQQRALDLFIRAYGEDHPHARMAAGRLRDALARGSARRR